MNRQLIPFIVLGLIIVTSPLKSQLLSRALLKADKLFIKKEYELASALYVQYLKRSPKEYYASRQAAICFDKVNDHYSAIDHWPAVIESSEVTEQDYLSFAMCLLANDREPEAKKLFALLAGSGNKEISGWGKTYLHVEDFYRDSALCNVKELQAINTSNSESCPLALSGKFIYMGNKGRSQRAFTPSNDPPLQQLNTMELRDSLAFSGTSIYEKLEQMAFWGPVAFNAEGTQLIYCKPVAGNSNQKDKGVNVRYQLFFLNLGTLHEKTPEIKPFKFNSERYDVMHPALSADGNRLFFASDMKGTLGGKDIFVCNWENNDWSTPVNLGAAINTAGDELFPGLAESGNLVFATEARPGLGGLDLFSAEPLEEGTFKTARNMGAPFNSRYDDFSLCYLKGFKKGYFSSNRKGNGDDDLFFFSLSN